MDRRRECRRLRFLEPRKPRFRKADKSFGNPTMTNTQNQGSSQFSEIRGLRPDILRDRILLDLIERLDRLRSDLERADSYELERLRVLVDNALRAVTDYLVELREVRHVENRR
jgi:hypothetical protein